MQYKRLIIAIILLIISINTVFAETTENKKSSYFNGVSEQVSTSPFVKFIGLSADNILIKLKETITPGILRLTHDEKDNDTVKLAPISSLSFIGVLLSVLLTLECVVLGIKSFFDEGISLSNIIKHLLTISLMIAFIAVLPIISEGLLNIFTTAGFIAGGGDKSGESYFPFMPSTILNMLGKCKNILDVVRSKLGGFSLKNLSHLPEILLILFSNFIIAVPYVIVSVMVIFWYLEFSIIVLISTISLPFSMFSYTSITDVKSIIKALLLQGIKIFLGVFLATLTGGVISDSLNKLELGQDTTINVIIYILLMTVVFIFGITKGPSIFINALSGTVSSSGMAFAIVPFLSRMKRKHQSKPSDDTKTNSTKHHNENNSTSDSSDEPRLDKSPSPSVSPNDNQEQEPPISVPPTLQTIQNQNVISKNKIDYPITSRATAERISNTYEKYKNEGRKNVSVQEIQERARWEATYQKLEHMKKHDFVDKNGLKNKEAMNQYRAMTKEKKSYLNGTTTWDGDKI